MQTQRPLSSPVLLNLSNLPWVPGRLKRNQALFCTLLAQTQEFSAGVYVNPPVIVSAPRKYTPYRAVQQISTETIAGKTVTILQPVYGLPDWHVPGLRLRWAAYIAKTIIGSMNPQRLWLWMNSAGRLQHAIAMNLLQHADFRVFDSSDDFTAWEPPDYQARLHQLATHADKLLCVNDHVAGMFDHPDKRVFSNCTDFDSFQIRNEAFRLSPWFPKRPGEVYIGFTGGINSTRADMNLLTTLFERFPHWRFLFIGYSDDPAFGERLMSYQNVTFIAERPYSELPEIIRAFNVAIVPHADNPTTRGNDLLKVLDYMACGVPVVSTRCSNVEKYRGSIYIAETPGEFGDLLDGLVAGAIRHNPDPGLRAAAARTWKHQVPGLLPWLTRRTRAQVASEYRS